MRSDNSLYLERARLIDEKFLGQLTAEQALRLAWIDDELDRHDAPRAEARLKQRRDAEFATIDRQLSELEAKIEKNAPDRPQAKTASSH